MGLAKENLAALLLYSVAVGCLLGILWDIFRIIRIAVYGRQRGEGSSPVRLPASKKEVNRALSFRHTRGAVSLSGILIFFSDLLFCLSASAAVILLIFHLNGGEIRGFALFGALLGFICYYFTVGKLTVLFSELIINGIKRLLHFVLSLTLIPVFKLLRRFTAFILRKLGRRIRKKQTEHYIKNKIKEAYDGFGLLKE